MTFSRDKIERTKIYLIPVLVILLAYGVYDAIVFNLEFAATDIILDRLVIPILIISTLMSFYWILLTEEFWNIYDKVDIRLGTKIKAILKFLIWIPGMGLYFFVVIKAGLGTINRIGEQKSHEVYGSIIDKDVFQNSGTTRYYFEISDERLNRSVEIRVTKESFNNFQIGETFQQIEQMGSLGFLYSKK